MDMNDAQFHATRQATPGEVSDKKDKFLLAKQLLVENLDKVKALLNVDEPIKGEKRTELIMALHTLHTAFDRMDTASYEYFEKSEVGVVEPKPVGE